MDGPAVVIAHGRVRAGTTERGLVRQAPLLICANGGTLHALRLGRYPDAVVGDLDSLPAAVARRLRRRGVEVVGHPRAKDETDTELAVREAIRRGAREIVMLGALGGRVDHALANVGVLARRWRARVSIVDGGTLIAPVGRRLALDARVGDIVSLIPYGGPTRGIQTQDLAYPLRGETLLPGSTRGISNVVIGPRPVVRVRRGTLLVVRVRGRTRRQQA